MYGYVTRDSDSLLYLFNKHNWITHDFMQKVLIFNKQSTPQNRIKYWITYYYYIWTFLKRWVCSTINYTVFKCQFSLKSLPFIFLLMYYLCKTFLQTTTKKSQRHKNNQKQPSKKINKKFTQNLKKYQFSFINA